MSEQQPQPGDMVNGYVLGNDGEWHYVGYSAASTTGSAQPVPPEPPILTEREVTPATPPQKGMGTAKGCGLIVIGLVVVVLVAAAVAAVFSGGTTETPAGTPSTASSGPSSQECSAQATAILTDAIDAQEKANAAIDAGNLSRMVDLGAVVESKGHALETLADECSSIPQAASMRIGAQGIILIGEGMQELDTVKIEQGTTMLAQASAMIE